METRLRWFRHVKRSATAPMRRCEEINLAQCRRGRGQPKMSWNAIIRSDMKYLGLTKDMTYDRNVWRFRIKIVDYR